MSGPLSGIKVVDCAQWLQGGAAGATLADLGADVIKVEDPRGGDPVRGWLQIGAAQTHKVERNYYLELTNRGKRSITLNLGKEKAREVIYKLIERADIFIHNWRTGTPQKLGVDYETLCRCNSRLIYAEVTSWGTEGPLQAETAYEATAMARSGMLEMVRGRDMPPLIWPSGIGDLIGATTAVIGILAALQARQVLGRGQKVSTSLLASLIAIETAQFHAWLLAGAEFPKRDRATMGNPLYNHYRCADDKWLNLSMLQPDRYWPTFCQAMGLKQLEKDPRFENMAVRARNSEELIRLLDKVFVTKPRAEWLQCFEQQGPGRLVYAPIQSVAEAVADPQVVANEYIVNFDHPVFGPIRTVGFPWNFSETPPALRRPAPELGQHTEEILQEVGYTREEIVRLKEQNIII